MGKVKFNVWPSDTVEVDPLDIHEALRGEAPVESVLKLATGESVTVLHSPREVQRMLRETDKPKLDVEDIKDEIRKRLGLKPLITTNEDVILEVLVEKINEALNQATK